MLSCLFYKFPLLHHSSPTAALFFVFLSCAVTISVSLCAACSTVSLILSPASVHVASLCTSPRFFTLILLFHVAVDYQNVNMLWCWGCRSYCRWDACTARACVLWWSRWTLYCTTWRTATLKGHQLCPAHTHTRGHAGQLMCIQYHHVIRSLTGPVALETDQQR